MLEYAGRDVSEGTDVNKINGLRKCIISHYWDFLDINFRFDPKVCNSYYDIV